MLRRKRPAVVSAAPKFSTATDLRCSCSVLLPIATPVCSLREDAGVFSSVLIKAEKTAALLCNFAVAPHVGAWIEIFSTCIMLILASRPPCGGVD